MKKIIAVICAIASLCLVLCSCGSVELPSEPATTAVVNKTVEKDVDGNVNTQTIDNVDFVVADYYLYGKSYAKIGDITAEDFGIGPINCHASVTLSGLSGSDDDFRISYTAYNSKNEVVSSSYILVPVKASDLKEGDTFSARFDLARDKGITKVEFSDYTAD